MSSTPDILTTFLVAVVFYLLGRGLEKMMWIEKAIHLDKLKGIFKRNKEEGVFEED